MTNIAAYFASFSEPVFTISTAGDSALCDSLWRVADNIAHQIAVRVCRGSKMRTVQGVFDEFAAAFQFPYYFGENWPAFGECLTDLSWLRASAYVVCISQADQLLAESLPSFEVLIRNLLSVARGWGGNTPDLAVSGQSPTPFHVLLQVPMESENAMLSRLASLGISTETINRP